MRPSFRSAVRSTVFMVAMLAWNAVPCLAQLSFTAPLEFPAGLNADAIATADFNHDGLVDVAVLNAGTGQVSVILGGGGLFQPPSTVSVGPLIAAVAVGDFNRDGDADLAVAMPDIMAVAIRLGNGDGTFLPPSFVPTGFHARGLAVGDFNEDHIDDVVAAGDASLLVIKGAMSGSFAALSTVLIPIPGFNIPAHSIRAADLNGDGHKDVVAGGVTGFIGL